jgi:hypothetical protein
MEQISLLTEEDLGFDSDEKALVHAWRRDQLLRHGLSYVLAETFADLVEWHAFAELVQRGCPPEVALAIVL